MLFISAREVKPIRLFLTAAIQVCLVTVNTQQIIAHHVIGSLVVGYLISLCWAFNVRGVVLKGKLAPYIYAAGAMVGTGMGLLYGYLFV